MNNVDKLQLAGLLIKEAGMTKEANPALLARLGQWGRSIAGGLGKSLQNRGTKGWLSTSPAGVQLIRDGAKLKNLSNSAPGTFGKNLSQAAWNFWKNPTRTGHWGANMAFKALANPFSATNLTGLNPASFIPGVSGIYDNTIGLPGRAMTTNFRTGRERGAEQAISEVYNMYQNMPMYQRLLMGLNPSALPNYAPEQYRHLFQ